MEDEQAGGLIHVATFLPLKSWVHVVPFLRLSSKVMKQAKGSRGAVNYSVKANFFKKHFWTFSIWKDQGSLRHFVAAEPYATAVRNFGEWAGEGAVFVEWSSPSDSIDWPEALERLNNLSFYYCKQT